MDGQCQEMFPGLLQECGPFGGRGGRHEQLADRDLVATPRCRQHAAPVDRGILPVDAGGKGQGERKGIAGQGETRGLQDGFGGKTRPPGFLAGS